MQDETDEATALIKRILFLGDTPDLSKRDALHIGKTVEEMLKNDLALALQVVAALREVMTFCESVQDYGTREMLQVMLKDTEDDHTH